MGNREVKNTVIPIIFIKSTKNLTIGHPFSWRFIVILWRNLQYIPSTVPTPANYGTKTSTDTDHQ